jgi:hypothetical protein
LLSVTNTTVALHGQSGMITSQTLNGVWGQNATSVYAAGGSGTLLRYYFYNAPTTQWSTQAVSGTLGTNYLQSLHGSAINPVRSWGVGGNGALMMYDGSTGAWSTHAQSGTNTGGLTTNFLYSVYTVNTNSAWASSSVNVVYRFDGATWVAQALPTKYYARAIWANNATDAWAVGPNDMVMRYQP